jgi:hypothetical protein
MEVTANNFSRQDEELVKYGPDPELDEPIEIDIAPLEAAVDQVSDLVERIRWSKYLCMFNFYSLSFVLGLCTGNAYHIYVAHFQVDLLTPVCMSLLLIVSALILGERSHRAKMEKIMHCVLQGATKKLIEAMDLKYVKH